MGFPQTKPRSIDQENEPRIETQKTLKSSICCTGVGLHSGAKISMVLNPADVDTGIVFRRTDIKGKGAVIPARWDHVVDTRLCTMLGNDEGVTIGTVEHLMAALAGCGISNAEIEINGSEVPVMDGSSEPFVFLIECAGTRDQKAPLQGVRVLKPVTVDNGRASAALYPGRGFSVGFKIDFGDDFIGQQDISVGLGDGTFKKELCRARTFGFLKDVEQLWAAGLALGGSLENSVVVSGDKVLNTDGLRYADEFVRHKALDAIGDLYQAGFPIIGRYEGECAGHALTNRLLRKLFADESAWCYDVVTVQDAAERMPVFSGEAKPRLAATA